MQTFLNFAGKVIFSVDMITEEDLDCFYSLVAYHTGVKSVERSYDLERGKEVVYIKIDPKYSRENYDLHPRLKSRLQWEGREIDFIVKFDKE